MYQGCSKNVIHYDYEITEKGHVTQTQGKPPQWMGLGCIVAGAKEKAQ